MGSVMSILKIADEIDDLLKEQEQLPWGTKQVYLDLAATIIRKQQAEIEALKARIEFMVENASHHEGIAHAGGFEAGWQSAQAELDSLRSVVYWLKENRPEVWDDIKKWSKM